MIYRTTHMQVRGNDQFGSGAFGAPRGSHTHHGIDLICEKGDLILSPVAGAVTKIGYPYDPTGPKGHFRYVEVTDDSQVRHRFFYITPMVTVNDRIRKGTALGEAQGLQDVYPGITDHIHYEVKLPGGGFQDPTSRIA